MSQKREKYINLAVCAAAFLFMLFLTAITPYFSDDWHFKFVWKDFGPTDNDELLRSFGGLIESAANYYKYSGGRVLCHFVLFIFESIDKRIFDIANAFVFAMFALLICKLIKRDRKHGTMWLLPLIFIYIFVFYKDFGDAMLWEAGAVNYLWSASLLLLAAKLADTDIEKLSVGKFIFTCIIVFLSSMTNEVTGGMLAILIFLTLLERKGKLSSKHLLLFAALTAGTAVLLSAPGNYSRLDSMDKVKLSLLGAMLKYFVFYFVFSWPFIYINIFSILYFYSEKKNIISCIVQHKYFAAGTAGILVLFVTKLAYSRPVLFGFSFIAISAGRSFFRLKTDISEKITSKRPDLAVKLLRTFFYSNICMCVLIIIRYIDCLEDLIVYTSLTVFIELLTFAVIKIISTEKGKAEFAQTAQKNKALFSKAAKFVPSAALALISASLISNIVYQTFLYAGDVEQLSDFLEEVYICAEEQGDFENMMIHSYEDDSPVANIMVERIYGKKSKLTPYALCLESCSNYSFVWLYKYCAYTGYTGRGY